MSESIAKKNQHELWPLLLLLLLLLLLQVYLFPCHGRNNQRFERLADGSLRFPGASQSSTLSQKMQAYLYPAGTWLC
jgi:hypothetical protein